MPYFLIKDKVKEILSFFNGGLEMKWFAFHIALLSVSLAFAETAEQTDWSNGPGIPGPVPDWGDQFDVNSGCSWSKYQGEICIERIVSREIGSIPLVLSTKLQDLDGDGDIDVIAGSPYEGGAFKWFENTNGLGISWIERDICEYPYLISSVLTDDLDSDGDIDALVIESTTGDIVWFENADGAGTDWIKHIVAETSTVNELYSVDMDGDSDIDVIESNGYYDFVTRWWENADGVGTDWIEHPIIDTLGLPTSFSSTDLDCDGDIDLLVAVYNDGDIVWLENEDGTGNTWTVHTITGAFNGAICVYSTDMDGDGDTDVLGAAYDDDNIVWWENVDGFGASWIEHMIASGYNGVKSVYSADMDGDGDADVLGAAYLANRVTWWENADGTGTEFIERVVDETYMDPFYVCSGDINGDGKEDVFAAGSNIDDLTWWNLSVYPYTASFESSILFTDSEPDWGILSWTAETPPGSEVAFQVRASDNSAEMGEWSDELTTAPVPMQGILADYASYVQYRVLFTTAYTDTTPTLMDMNITWDPLMGIDESHGPDTFELLPFSPNPFAKSATVRFSLPCTATAGFQVFDVSGRLVRRILENEYSAGYHNVLIDNTQPGIYFCRMVSGDYSAVQRFVVTE